MRKGVPEFAQRSKIMIVSRTEDAIGDALATRALLDMLRQSGDFRGGPSPFARSDRSRFLSKLDELVHAARRDAEVRRAGWPNSSTTWRDGRDDPGNVPDLCDGSARCLEADAQEDFLEGFSLRGADHS